MLFSKQQMCCEQKVVRAVVLKIIFWLKVIAIEKTKRIRKETRNSRDNGTRIMNTRRNNGECD